VIVDARTRVAPYADPRGARVEYPVRIERLAALDAVAPMDAAEAFRGVPGLVLLESARPGRRSRWTYLSADPRVVVEAASPGRDPFAEGRAQLGRLAPGGPWVAADDDDGDVDPLPAFVGGLMGFIGYDLGRVLERLPSIAADDQDLPPLRLALHDWAIAWDRRTGRAWLGGRALDGDVAGLTRRLDDVRERLTSTRSVPSAADLAGQADPVDPADQADAIPDDGFTFSSGLDRSAYEAGVRSIRAAIADGQIYQANLTRRLESPFAGDPWPLYRRLRTGDPALHAAYLDLGAAAGPGSLGRPARRAILSASPEPFLAVDPTGLVTTDPIKGTRPRGRDRDGDRALARELLLSGKDRAENVMIVDVLRNDLGRVCRPGSVRVPRLCRLERTAAVQHLVSTVTGRLAPGRDPFDLVVAAFPGGSITGAPKIRAMEILEALEPVRRGAYTGALGWFGPDGAMSTSILIRTLVADGQRLTLHVGGGITWRSDPAAEWDETVAKASGPLGAIGGREADALDVGLEA
jgi:para-aminobenzoate synthetase component 1